MDLSASTVWWTAAGVLVAAELVTGTLYLLMIALGFAAGALATQGGLGGTWQVLIAALVAGGATAVWHVARSRRPRGAPASSNRNVNLDIGERVQVIGWNADGTANVRHRGTGWTARLQPGASATTGEHFIVAVEGNWLVLAPVPATDRPALASH